MCTFVSEYSYSTVLCLFCIRQHLQRHVTTLTKTVKCTTKMRVDSKEMWNCSSVSSCVFSHSGIQYVAAYIITEWEHMLMCMHILMCSHTHSYTKACAGALWVRCVSPVRDLQKIVVNIAQDFCHHWTHGERSLPRQHHWQIAWII